jgi:hypothetical protein
MHALFLDCTVLLAFELHVSRNAKFREFLLLHPVAINASFFLWKKLVALYCTTYILTVLAMFRVILELTYTEWLARFPMAADTETRNRWRANHNLVLLRPNQAQLVATGEKARRTHQMPRLPYALQSFKYTRQQAGHLMRPSAFFSWRHLLRRENRHYN